MPSFPHAIAFVSPGISPTFAGNKFFFGFAVFCQMAVLMQALMVMWDEAMLLNERRRQWNAPVTADRVMTILLMLTIVLLVGPLTVENLVRAEVEGHTRFVLARIVNVAAAFAVVPLITAALIKSMSRYVITLQLEKEPYAVDPTVRWTRIRKTCLVMLLVGLIALLATLR